MKRPEPPSPEPLDPLEAWLAGDLASDSETESALLSAAATAGEETAVQAELAAHRRLREQVRSLPLELSSERDLWPEIADRIGARHRAAPTGSRGFWERPVSVPRWAALAALLAVALGTGFLLRHQQVAIETPPVAFATPSPRPSVALAAYAKTDRELDAVRDELWRSIQARQRKLPPQTRAVVFANLRTIESAIAEIEAALAASPADAQLGRTYIAYRERQIAVLRQANELAARL